MVNFAKTNNKLLEKRSYGIMEVKQSKVIPSCGRVSQQDARGVWSLSRGRAGWPIPCSGPRVCPRGLLVTLNVNFTNLRETTLESSNFELRERECGIRIPGELVETHTRTFPYPMWV